MYLYNRYIPSEFVRKVGVCVYMKYHHRSGFDLLYDCFLQSSGPNILSIHVHYLSQGWLEAGTEWHGTGVSVRTQQQWALVLTPNSLAVQKPG